MRFELRFPSLLKPGTYRVFPCDEWGNVNTEAMTPALRQSYLEVIATLGRDYLHSGEPVRLAF